MTVFNMIHAFIGSILVGLFFVYSGSKLLNTKITKGLKTFLMLFFIIILLTLSSLFFENALKMMMIYIIVLFIYKESFHKNVSQCSFAALISYLLLVIGELIFAVGIAVVDKFVGAGSIDKYPGNLFVNLSISLIALLILLLIYKPFRNYISKIKENSKASLIFTFALLLVTIWFLFYKIYINDFKFDEILLINGFLIIAMIYICVIMIKQRYDKSRLSEEYETYVEYSKQSEKLVEQYSISQHENKNELIIIRSMVHKNNVTLLSYLDEILKSKDNIENAWIRHLRYIPFGGLKGIMHNKISEMMDLNIKVFIDISKEIEKSNLKKLTIKENSQLLKIVSVLLDNAREASVKSEQKECSICIYMEKDVIIFEIANSYEDFIDINSINAPGFSSKGKNRGYGLTIVKNIVEDNSIFENISEIRNGYFVQIIKIYK